MTSGWESAKDMSKKHAESGGLFVQLKEHGDKIAGVFCGEPYAREVVWDDEEGYTPYDPNGKHAGQRASLRVALNFYVPTEGATYTVKHTTRTARARVQKLKYRLDVNTLHRDESAGGGGPQVQDLPVRHHGHHRHSRPRVAR